MRLFVPQERQWLAYLLGAGLWLEGVWWFPLVSALSVVAANIRNARAVWEATR